MLLKELHSAVREWHTEGQHTATIEFDFDEGKKVSKHYFEQTLDSVWSKIGDSCGYGNGWEYVGQHDDPSEFYLISAESSEVDTDITKLTDALQVEFGGEDAVYIHATTNED